jgi:hypothetical protein
MISEHFVQITEFKDSIYPDWQIQEFGLDPVRVLNLSTVPLLQVKQLLAPEPWQVAHV